MDSLLSFPQSEKGIYEPETHDQNSIVKYLHKVYPQVFNSNMLGLCFWLLWNKAV